MEVKTTRKLFRTISYLLFFSLLICQVTGSPVNPKQVTLKPANDLTILQDSSPTTNPDPPAEEDDGGWSWKTWLWISLGIVVLIIIIPCIISYLFCAAAKSIICLPFKCLKKAICCCCD